MNDKEKVELGIKACWSEYFSHKCFDCPYMPDRNDRKCVERLGADAIALLKEQQEEIENLKMKEQQAKYAIKQTYHIIVNRDYENPVEVTRCDWLCPTCKSLLCRDIDVIDENYHFCKVCGQELKWE